MALCNCRGANSFADLVKQGDAAKIAEFIEAASALKAKLAVPWVKVDEVHGKAPA